MAKVLILGIDGFDPVLLRQWQDQLPHLSNIINENNRISLESTIPPDSICAWATIFTGRNPAEHGLIESIDYLSSKKESSDNRGTYFKGKTFWDVISRKGMKVCIINPFLAFPAWEVNGLMVSGPVFEDGQSTGYPKNILNEYDFPPLGGMVDFPDESQLQQFIEKTKETTEQLADVGLKIAKEKSPDLLFISFLTLDRIKHFLWKFCDKNDPYYTVNNPFEGTIIDFYKIFDKIVGYFMDIIDRDSVLLILSDHGHGKRCTKKLNLNEFLRSKGFLVPKGKGAERLLKKLIEKFKVFLISEMTRYNLHDYIHKVAKLLPNRNALKKSTYLVDRNISVACLSNLCGTNPYGGVDIINSSAYQYQEIRDEIISAILSINELLGKEVVKWVKPREQIYSGEFLYKLPDIMFELNEDFGVGFDLFTTLVSDNHTHKKISGGHKREGVFLMHSLNNKGRSLERPNSLLGINAYILNLIEM